MRYSKALAALILGSALTGMARAGTIYTWGGGTGAWDVAGSWNPAGGPPNGTNGDTGVISSGNATSDAVFTGNSVTGTPTSGTLNNAAITVNTGGTLTLGDPGITNAVTLSGGSIVTVDTNTLNSGITTTGTTASSISTQFNMFINGGISGTGSIGFTNTAHTGTVAIGNGVTTGWSGGLSVTGGTTAIEKVEFDTTDGTSGTGPINLIGGNAAVSIDNGGSSKAFTNSSISGNGSILSDFRLVHFSGTTLSPGNPTVAHSVGVLKVGFNINNSAGNGGGSATYIADLNSSSSYDQLSYGLATDGNIENDGKTTADLTNITLQTNLNYAPSHSDALFIVLNSSSNPTTGTFVGLPEGATVNLGSFSGTSYTATISYLGNGDGGSIGNDVELTNFTPTPEPASLALIGFAAAGLLMRRRASARIG